MAAFRVEERTGHVGHAAFYRLLEQFRRIQRFRQLRKQEESAFWTAEFRSGRETLQLVSHGVQLVPIAGKDRLNMRLQQAAPQKSVHHCLRQIRRMQIGALLPDGAFADNILLPVKIPKPQSGADDLGKTAAVDHIAFPVKALDGRECLTRIAKIAVGIVLHHQKMILCRQFRNFAAALQRKRPAGGILEAGNHIKQLRVILAGSFFQCIDQNAVFIAGNGNQIGLVQPKGLHISQKGGAFHQHRIPRIEERLAKQIHAGRASRGRQHVRRLRFKAVMLLQIGDQAFHKGRIPFGSPILQNPFAIVQQHLPGELGAFPVGKGFGGRASSREGNHVGAGQHLKDFPNGTAGHMIESGGKAQSFWQHDSHSPLHRRRLQANTKIAFLPNGRKARKIAVPLPFVL